MNTSIEVRCDSHSVATAVRRAWRNADDNGMGDRAVSSLTVGLGAESDVSGRHLEEVLHLLSPAVTQRVIALNRGELVMLHAAALADPETGATAVLVAPSGTGKTTVSRTLGREFAYLSDETAAITREGIVLPYRKPLSVLPEDGHGHLKSQHSPSDLGLLTTERPCRIAALLLIERVPDHPDTPVVTALETIDAIAAIAPQASYLPSLDNPLHRLAEVIQHAGGAHRVTYREAGTLGPVLRQLLKADG